ncbi:hypothetical protein EIP91_010539 [Steccherinum ochraceum]|uniref:Blue (type 1) copper domain-containing protein n=1 Tax=Steccherinum ochraceum TaxID=92696 RepID=A0A4V2MUX3_9APHY|nr:hypothetical protein EIP91_010539 [Steccherinum ochraceum]
MFQFIALLSALPIALAQTVSTSQTTVQVAPGGKFVYGTDTLNIDNGGNVVFTFPGGAIPHSVTQSSFEAPCTPLSGGFDSGLTSGTSFQITITDKTKPIYYFCKATGHCGEGMVGVINPPADGTQGFSDFQAAAVKIGGGEAAVPDNGFVSGGVGATATVSPSAGQACTTTTVGGSVSTSCSGGGSSSSNSTNPSNSSSSSGAGSSTSSGSSSTSGSPPSPTNTGGAQNQGSSADRVVVGGGLILASVASIFGFLA